jgi:hypothetical protein
MSVRALVVRALVSKSMGERSIDEVGAAVLVRFGV